MSAAETFDDPFGGIHAGGLEARLARTDAEIDAAQALRYRVFYDEMNAEADARTAHTRRDVDAFDPYWDHLLVIDRERAHPEGSIIGTYRINRRSEAEKHRGFYTVGEYDIAPLLAMRGEIMELGRSCVDREYRNRATMGLLWRAIAAYVFHYDVELMFGCASLPGVDPDRLALPLSFLHREHLAPAALRPRALPRLHVAMNRLAPDEEIDPRAARLALPPLVKGYLRLGGFVGDGAVIDRQFRTTDVCIVVKTALVTQRYLHHYAQGPSPRPDGV